MLSLIISILFHMGVAKALLVPAPPGPYSVAVKNFEVLDSHRIDTLAPEPNTKRRFMASAYLPVDARYGCKTQIVPYMPALTASVFGKTGETLGVPQGTLEKFEMEFCDLQSVQLHHGSIKKKFPVVVFDSGLGGTRLVYGAVARSLASLGYIVITLDHTYETEVVEFPDGTVAYASNSTSEEDDLQPLVEIRTRDISFLISQLSNTTFTAPLFANFPGTFDPHHIAVYGHSLGGATAATTAQRDARVIGGINFDGTIFDQAVREKAFHGKPFLLVASPSNLDANGSVLEWDSFYNKLDAVKLEMAVKDTQHYAFMDVPLLLTVYHVPPASQPTVDQIFGTLSGKRIEKAMNDIMAGLSELLFHKSLEPLKKLGKNKDIEVVRSDLSKCD